MHVCCVWAPPPHRRPTVGDDLASSARRAPTVLRPPFAQHVACGSRGVVAIKRERGTGAGLLLLPAIVPCREWAMAPGRGVG